MNNERSHELTEQDMVRLLQRMSPRPAPPPAMREAVRAQVHAVWLEQTARRKSARTRYLGLAASLLGAAVLLWQVWTPQEVQVSGFALAEGNLEWSADGSRWAAADATRELAAGMVRAPSGAVLTQSDRSSVQVRLHPTAVLRLEGGRQLALLEGQVYADTGDDSGAGRGLVIDTPRGRVTDIGTRFMVALEAGALAVSVRDGKVELNDGQAVHQASGGSRLRVQAAGPPTYEQLQPWDESWSWASQAAPIPAIEGMSALNFLEWAARERGVKLEYVDENARLRAQLTTLHGDVSHLAAPDLLDAVMSTTDLAVDTSAPGSLKVGLRH